MELPPRTRRIPLPQQGLLPPAGTTSAHAENTKCLQTLRFPDRNYLRARGEYLIGVKGERIPKELPPRTRRIRVPESPPAPPRGTTSAHAENTVSLVPLARES